MSNKAHVQAVKRHKAKSTRWECIATNGTDKAMLLKKAKASGKLPEKFWIWLEREWGEECNAE